MERYTSPELSRQLAEAGLEQSSFIESRPCPAWRLPDDAAPFLFEMGMSLDALRPPYFRALDLTDVLEELQGLGSWRWNLNYDTQMEPGKAIVCTCYLSKSDKMTYHFADSPVEAAGLVLLALLKERAK